MDPDSEPGGPKHVNPVEPDSDPDPQHCMIQNELAQIRVPITTQNVSTAADNYRNKAAE
jgi:hypothetical protein